jgi:hypothetical protein
MNSHSRVIRKLMMSREDFTYRLRHLNMDMSISRFLANVEGLSRLPFMTDSEMLLVYGEEVVDSSTEMARYNHEAGLCSKCQKRCCPMVHCELYDTGFSRCPVYEYRPAICRMHFCEKFSVGDTSFVREFADIYINSLLEAKLEGSLKADLFDSPPLSKFAPEFLAAVAPSLDAFKTGNLIESDALRYINAEAEKFRTSPATLKKIVGTSNKELEIALAEARRHIKGR